MNSKRAERQYCTADRRTSNSIVKPIFYLMLEFILIGIILILIYTMYISIFNEVVTFIIMGAFGLLSFNYMRTSCIPRFKKVLSRQKR